MAPEPVHTKKIQTNTGSFLVKIFPDARIPILILLCGYLVLGLTVLGFNRSPAQILYTSLSACALELLLMKLFGKKLEFPLSALITSLGLSILLNYSHSIFLPLIPVFFAIGSKYVITYKGRHFLNPAMAGVVFSLICTQELISSAPAYQWNGIGSMAYFVAFPALMFFMPSINRFPLVISYLVTFTITVALRALIMRHHLPFETLFWGTLSSPAFLLFAFFMITDPKTSPQDRKEQIWVGIALALVDLSYHLRQSYYTFFYSAFTVAGVRFTYFHLRDAFRTSFLKYFKDKFILSGYYMKPVTLALVAALGFGTYRTLVLPTAFAEGKLNWKFEKLDNSKTGIHGTFDHVYEQMDPRIQHILKWVLSVGDSVAVGDFDGDGLPDLFFNMPLKSDGDRLALYKNLGNGRFQRVPLPALEARAHDIKKYGLPTNAMFVDYDNDGDLDLFITYAFGSPVLLKNMLKETGRPDFVDVTKEVGLEHYTNSVAATFLDFNRDGLLDLFIANVLPDYLPDYDHPTLLNFFKLPDPEYPGDRRMFHFMHESWNNANNGGMNELYLQTPEHKFVKQDSNAVGITDTHWSLAVGTGDLNHDGWTDLYVANDFGPDDLYLNEGGKRFKKVKGSTFGSVGRDTYKGMNVSIQDFTHNGWLDVYISDVHHEMQAEGSLLWMFYPPRKPGDFVPRIEEEATQRGALNESRFGWGAAAADFDNDGWIDIAQANGHIDDSIDKKYDKCPDYWYVNEKLARSPPSIHSYADMWGDIRGMCIYGHEANRLYLNRGADAKPQFVDVADSVGLGEPGMSRGMAAVDLNNSGRLDLVVTHMFTEPTIYKNTLLPQASSPHWIGFSMEGDGGKCNRGGMGSTVTLTYTDAHGTKVSQMKEVQVVDGLSAQNDPRLHFGLGKFQGPVRAEVKWCGQWIQSYTDLEVDRYHTLVMQ